MIDPELAAAATPMSTPPTRWTEQRKGARDLSDDTFDRVGEREGLQRDWREHVPRRIEDLWPQLSMFERALASEIAQLAADGELDD